MYQHKVAVDDKLHKKPLLCAFSLKDESYDMSLKKYIQCRWTPTLFSIPSLGRKNS